MKIKFISIFGAEIQNPNLKKEPLLVRGRHSIGVKKLVKAEIDLNNGFVFIIIQFIYKTKVKQFFNRLKH